MKAADIPDELAVAAAVEDAKVRRVENLGGSLWTIQERLGMYPPKVVQAKFRSLIKRGKMTGCACGCRGDFLPVEK